LIVCENLKLETRRLVATGAFWSKLSVKELVDGSFFGYSFLSVGYELLQLKSEGA